MGNCSYYRVCLRVCLGLFTLALATPASTASAADRPNILFIMADDHAAHAIGAYGGRFAKLNPTPNIDRLAREGARLTNCFCTNSICVPSRATIITGQYSHSNGVTTLVGGVKPEDQTLAILMRQAGYETAMIGKWHLHYEPNFDYYAVLPGQGNYFNPVLRIKGYKGDWPQNERRFASYNSLHSSQVITDLAIRWLKTRRQKDKPFFLMYHFKSPHDNFENAEKYDWYYEDIEMPEPDSLWHRGRHGPIGRPRYGTSIGPRNQRRNMGMHMFVDPNLPPKEYTHIAYQRYMKKYFRCVKGLDDNLGRMIAYLEQSGQLDNTVIFYTSDQGMMLGEHDYIDKRWMYEESLRMPMIVRYPKAVPAGLVCDSIVNNVDFAPTILDFAGVKSMPDSFQGRSFRPLVEGKGEPPDWPQETYYRYWMHMAHHDNPAHYGIRTKRYKLIFFYGLPLDAPGAQKEPTPPYWELYDLQKDPHEMNNVINDPEYAGVVKDLKRRLLELKKKVGDTDEKYPELMELRRKYWD